MKFRELRESKRIEGEADCESFSKHSTHIPPLLKRIAHRSYFSARGEQARSLRELLLHLYPPFSCDRNSSASPQMSWDFKRHARGSKFFSLPFFLVKTPAVSRGHFLTALSTTLIFATSLGDEAHNGHK